jgi:hypothetical protein
VSRERNCPCLLCSMEHRISERFAAPHGQVEYRQFASSTRVLSGFANPLDLLAFLHTHQLNGNHDKDSILIEFLRAIAGRNLVAQELFLLAFVPVLHSVARHVLRRYPLLCSDDVAQHTVTAFLELSGSGEFLALDSHVAFAMSRLLRRRAFIWAEREARACMMAPVQDEPLEITNLETVRPIERIAQLRHFLLRCQQRGIISSQDLELLAQFKFEELPAQDYSNASRQRMKRLVGKLRRAAKPLRKIRDDRQLQLF